MLGDASEHMQDFDYSMVLTPARIAVYDDMLSAPHIIEIAPSPTAEFIEQLASTIYAQASQKGGSIPYSAIREVSENFIHAKFSEIVVSILDQGNTIRFADQGPGIVNKEKAQLPGFTSAIEPMKRYIRGVGSGLPLVKEYLHFTNGKISIEDNLESGAVVTLSLAAHEKPVLKEPHEQQISFLVPPLTSREREFLILFAREGALGVTDLRNLTDMPNSTIYNTVSRLEEAGLLDKTDGKKRTLSDFGIKVSQTLL